MLSRYKEYLYKFFTASFKLSASKALGPTVRLCDIGTLYYKLLKPWQSNCDFFDNCMLVQNLINKYEEEKDWRKEVKIKPDERINLDILTKITHNSIPVMGLSKSFASRARNRP